MTEHPNAAAFRRAFADMTHGNFDTFRGLLAADVVWHEAGNPQPVRGRDSVMKIFAGLMASGLEFEEDLHEVLANDTHLVALIGARIRKSDAEIAYPVAEIAHVHKGEITERWAFMDAVPADVAAFFAD